MKEPVVKSALICGVTGQDGSYLAQFLLQKGYVVWGTCRAPRNASLGNLHTLGIAGLMNIIQMTPEDFGSVSLALEQSNPDEIYFLAGQSSVAMSFEQPAETMRSVVLGALNLLEACRIGGKPVRLFHAGSGECFGDTQGIPADESTPFNPRSPYAVAKSSAYWLVRNYREAYKLHACSGILFNHESPLRPERFVTRKIISAAKRIAAGSNEKLLLGRMDIARDWGWAPEYVEAMWLMLQPDQPEDFVIATGESHTLEEFVQTTFSAFDLDWRNHIEQDASLFRPSDVSVSAADPSKAKRCLGWNARARMPQVVEKLIEQSPDSDLTCRIQH